ncbi:MAG: hypothetical protein AAF945_04440 [Actinomycetota bacterium]
MFIHRTNTHDHDRRTNRRTSARRTSALLGVAVAATLGAVAWFGAVATAGSDSDACDARTTTYRLSEPGSYSAFTRSSSGSVALEVLGADGESLVESPARMMTANGFDLRSAMRFGVPVPAVFEVESSVDLRVESADEPFDLVVVRLSGSDEWSGREVQAPVTTLPETLDGCGPTGSSPVRTIDPGGVYSDVTAHQVFVISSDG